MGLFFKKTKPSEDLIESGVRGRAIVEHTEYPHGGMEVNLSRHKSDLVLSGELTPIRKKVRLRLEVPGLPVTTVETTLNVPLMKDSWITAGSWVEILVDPEKTDRFAVDWNGQHQRGTAEQAIADSPSAQNALAGMGLDPARVAREADDARRKALEAQGKPPAG